MSVNKTKATPSEVASYEKNNKQSEPAQANPYELQSIGKILRDWTLELLNKKLDEYDAVRKQHDALRAVRPVTDCLLKAYCDHYSKQEEWKILKIGGTIKRLHTIHNQLYGKIAQEYQRIDTKALKEAVDCRQIAANYLPLKQHGKAWTGKCPFHKDRSPSLAVYADGYKCFGCGEKGDAINLVMRLEKTDFKQSVERVKEYA